MAPHFPSSRLPAWRFCLPHLVTTVLFCSQCVDAGRSTREDPVYRHRYRSAKEGSTRRRSHSNPKVDPKDWFSSNAFLRLCPQIQKKRRDLRLIVASATLDAKVTAPLRWTDMLDWREKIGGSAESWCRVGSHCTETCDTPVMERHNRATAEQRISWNASSDLLSVQKKERKERLLSAHVNHLRCQIEDKSSVSLLCC